MAVKDSKIKFSISKTKTDATGSSADESTIYFANDYDTTTGKPRNPTGIIVGGQVFGEPHYNVVNSPTIDASNDSDSREVSLSVKKVPNLLKIKTTSTDYKNYDGSSIQTVDKVYAAVTAGSADKTTGKLTLPIKAAVNGTVGNVTFDGSSDTNLITKGGLYATYADAALTSVTKETTDDSTNIATTAFVQSLVSSKMSGISGALHYIDSADTTGDTLLSDGLTTNPVTIAGKSVTAVSGDVVLQAKNEYIFNGTEWKYFGATVSAAAGSVASTTPNSYVVGKITINGSTTTFYGQDNNTDTQVTSADNHYTPSRAKTISATGGGSAKWDTTQMVTGIDVDAKGHVVGVSSIKMPAEPQGKNIVGGTITATSNTTTALTNNNVFLNHVEGGVVKSTHNIKGTGATTVTTDASGNIIINSTNTNTTYTAGTGLTLSGTTFKTKLNSETSLGTIGTTDKLYAVGVDANGKLAVNVPWVDLTWQ